MTFLEPFRGSLGLELLIVFTSSDFYLDTFGLGDVGLCFGDTGFSLGVVAVLSKICDLGYRRFGLGADLDQIELHFVGFLEGVCKR